MLFRCSMARLGLLLVSVSVGLFTTGCRSSQYALLQYQRPASSHLLEAIPATAQTDTLPVASLLSEKEAAAAFPAPQFVDQPKAAHHPQAVHVRNPEVNESNRKRWFRRVSLNRDPSITEFAPHREPPVLTNKRRVPGLVKASLAGGVVSQGLLLLGTASGTIWILAILVPLASVLLGIAGLAKVARRREEYRGKGWAMSAILLATGALGLALVAAAALATSEVVWK